ncbi:helix-turn-helix protein [Rhizobium sp. PP-WC-2G-219]|nr:helix-turn-helix protein [Rhizobium sp. PP-WC-2G-219]TCP74501.1 helix-turn-helix protein [Rhizobium sp. PP-CC-2G-626]TCQ03358.1 helix-turn-helix protein [Rhizobium sp. PP-F2F-G36]
MTSNNAPTDEDAQIGARIRKRRKALGVTRKELAAAAGVGTSQISKYELGTNRVPPDRILRFADVLKVNVTYLFADYFSVEEVERVLAFVGSPEAI